MDSVCVRQCGWCMYEAVWMVCGRGSADVCEAVWMVCVRDNVYGVCVRGSVDGV